MVYSGPFGKGRVVYFPFNLDQVFWEDAVRDHLYLLRNAVVWATGELQPMIVEGAGLVDVSFWRQEQSLAAHLVNLNSPAAMKGFIHETVPVGPLTVNIEIPRALRPGRVRLLEAGQDAKSARAGDRLIVQVPRILRHEVIAIDVS